MRGIRVLGSVLAAAALLVACGGDDNGGTAATSTTAPVARADRYLELVEPVNCAIATTQQVDSIRELRSAATKLADAERDFVSGLHAQRWAPDVQPSIDNLADLAAKQADQWDAAASSNSNADWERHLNAINVDATSTAVADVRAKLGLAQQTADTPLCPGHGG